LQKSTAAMLIPAQPNSRDHRIAGALATSSVTGRRIREEIHAALALSLQTLLPPNRRYDTKTAADADPTAHLILAYTSGRRTGLSLK